MYVFRLCRAGFKALDGEGARLYGGRWNSPGRPVIYTSSTLALAALEYLVHVEPADAPADLVALTIEIPDALPVQTVAVSSLPKGWAKATGSTACQDIGDAWLAAGACSLLRVPAAPIPEDANVLVNPLHPAAAKIAIVSERPFTFDPRLLE
jgi:RES domain-containing protein